jgi:hypothetical protein
VRTGALTAAEAAPLPPDSLLLAALLWSTASARVLAALGGDYAAVSAACAAGLAPWRAGWASDAALLQLAARCLAALAARQRDGTLFTLRADEAAYFEDPGSDVPPRLFAADVFVCAAVEALTTWPWPTQRAAAEERLRAMHGALRAALQMDALSHTERCRRSGRPWMEEPLNTKSVRQLLDMALDARGELLRQLRAECGMTAEEEEALRTLAARNSDVIARTPGAADAVAAASMAGMQAFAAADVARHGLRACALPGCGAVEPHAKAFKVCSRCRRPVYRPTVRGCAAHQQQDWRRHKREGDGCKAPA